MATLVEGNRFGVFGSVRGDTVSTDTVEGERRGVAVVGDGGEGVIVGLEAEERAGCFLGVAPFF